MTTLSSSTPEAQRTSVCLEPHYLWLHDSASEEIIAFRCEADDKDHANEQAQNAYPDFTIISCFVESEYMDTRFVVYSLAEAVETDGAGCWCNLDGWTSSPHGTTFAYSEIADIALPESRAQDSMFIPIAVAISIESRWKPAIEIDGHYRFDYPSQFISMPEYTAYAGQTIRVLRQLTLQEADQGEGMERMFEFQAVDGFIGHAFESELAHAAT